MLSFIHVFCLENGPKLIIRDNVQRYEARIDFDSPCATASFFHVAFKLANDDSNGNFLPIGFSQGIGPSPITTTFHTFELNSSFPFATMDYGGEVSGYPSGNVESFTGKVQIEFKYSEEFAGQVNNLFGDGPFPFAQGLSNAYRKATVEIV